MRIRYRKKHIFFAILLLFVLYLLWGPLFPWNPVKPGYKKIESENATVYITEFDGDSVVYKLDEIIQEEEAFHGLEFKEKFRIVVLGKESNMKRYLPWIRGKGYSVKLGSLNVIYIGTNARNSTYGIGVFLKHEISHLLIHQNTSSSSNNMEILKQGWLAEGIATYFGGPLYFEKEEFTEIWNKNGLSFNMLYEENPHEMSGDYFQLKYTYYRFFIEFLLDTYGMEKFHEYLKSYTENPKDYKIIFSQVYNEEIDEILRKYSAYMKL